MSVKSLLRQSLSVYGVSGYGSDGRETVGSATAYPCRFQATTKNRMLPNNTLVTIEAIAYVQSDAVVSIGDKVAFDSIDYKIVGKYATPNGAGVTEFVKLELVRWKQ